MSKEIRNKIELLNKELEGLFDPTTYVLKPRVEQIIKEVCYLQTICQHEFVDGSCKYCGTAKEVLYD